MVFLAFGLLLTVAWLWAGWYYVTVYFGRENIFYLLPAELGLFLIGFFAPLGILWLLVSQSFLRRRLAKLEGRLGELVAQPVTERREPSFDANPTAEQSGPETVAPNEAPPGDAKEADGRPPSSTATRPPATS